MLDPVLEETIGHPPRSSARSRAPRTPTRFERWAWSPIFAYRVGLGISYASMIYFGISSLIAGVPVFDITAPGGWTPVWASILIFGGIVACLGSTGDSKRQRRVELLGAWALFLTLSIYAGSLLYLAYGTGDLNRAAVGSGFVALGVAPGIRLLWLMTQLGRKPYDPTAESVDVDRPGLTLGK